MAVAATPPHLASVLPSRWQLKSILSDIFDENTCMGRTRKLLTLAHSYAVALNRRLAHELAQVGAESWEVTAVAPRYFHGKKDLRPVVFEALTEEPCPVVPLNAYLTRYVHVFFYGSQLRSLLTQSWDIVHCWEEPYIVAGSQAAFWKPRHTPLVYACFQNIAKRYPPPFCWIERACLARAAGWIAFGHTVAEVLGRRPGYPDRPSRIISPGVDLKVFQPDPAARKAIRCSLGWNSPEPPVVGFLGRFLPEKGLPLLMRVLDGLTCPWRALFVGAGPLESNLRDWASRQGSQVRVCTDVKHNAVPAYLNAMDVLCAPSQTTPRWREQFGRMLIEAFACAVPVLGSDSGEVPYVVGDAGIIVGEDDEAGWRKALEDLLNDPARRRELGERGRERAHTHYAWPVVARRHLDFFEEILAGRRNESSEEEIP
jgi:glycosyltransferase involved in cell wall biosynthesis